jgi:putative membrane protein
MTVLNIVTAAAIISVAGAYAQTPTDPYNPQSRRVAVTTVEPTLADMGFGTDEGNVGPFVTNTDKQYAQAMMVRGMMEIRLGQAAVEKSERADVKALAQRLIGEYLKWDDGMQKAAVKLGIPVPSDMDAKQKAEVERISALSGPAFDQAYLKEVIHLQQKALTMSNHEASNASVSGFRHYAGVVLPTIQDQIATAQRALDADGTTISRK